MQIFRGKPGRSRFDLSLLCSSCKAKFKKVFQRDEAGNLNLSELPRACKACQLKLERMMDSSRYPDRE